MTESLLSKWYADPLNTDEARQQLQEVRSKLMHAHEQNYQSLRIQEVIARFWLDRDISGDIDNLQATCKDEHCRALIKLIYGQLLISRKLKGGLEYLQQGFKQATNLFPAADYLEVMRRHERLNNLQLTEKPAKPQALQDLLIEADVIKKLKGKEKYHCDILADNKDTVG